MYKIVSQDIKENRGDDWYTEISVGHNEDSRRGQYDDYRDGGNNSKGEHQQLDHKCYQYSRSIRELVILYLEQHGGPSISNSKDVS